jgi:hypothetical protein
MFIYEVAGLRQSDQTDNADTTIRSSSNMLAPVPFSRMNSFMQRVSQLGGKIVAIHDSMEAATTATAPKESTKAKD